MRLAWIIILFFIFVHQVSAQEMSVPVKEKFRLFKSKVKKLSTLDTVKLPNIPDSLLVAAADTIKRPTTFTRLKQRADSLKLQANKSDTLKSIGFQKPAYTLDSANIKNLPTLNDLPTNSVNKRVTAAADKISNRTIGIQEKLKSKTDSIEIPDQLRGLQEKLGNEINVNQLEQKEIPIVGNNPSLLVNQQNPSLALPDLSTNVINVPDVNSTSNIPGLPDVKVPEQKTDLPNINPKAGIPAIAIPTMDIPTLDEAEQVQDKLPTGLPNLHKPDSAQVKELTNEALEDERLKKYAEPIGDVTDRIDPYKKNLDSLTIRDAGEIASKEAEAVLENTDAMKTLNGYTGQGKTALTVPDAAMLQRYQDKRILKEEILRKSKSVMNDKISSLTPQVKDQQQKLGKAKKLNSSVPSVKNMKEKRSEPLKERPLCERIVPGISFQTHKSDVFAVDLAPQISWRFSTFLSAGVGMFYRVGFDQRYDYFAAGQGIHGFRTFTDYRLVKGLFVHAEYEMTYTSQKFAFADPASPTVFNSMYVGLGKRYLLSRKIYGNLIALYKIEMKDHLAGTSKFNLRVVLEYKTKKVRKPTDI